MLKLSRRQTLASMLATGAGIAAPATRAASGAASTRVSFLLVNDVYRIDENKDGRGGMARFAAAVKAERARALAEDRHLVCVHAGDTLSPSLLSNFDQGAHMIDLFNEVGLDVFVPGNHEFDFGKEVYFERIKEARFPILAANLKGSDGATPPHHREGLLIEADGLKLALIGAAYEDTVSASRPGDLAFASTIPAVLAGAKRARAAGADLVIAIVHADKATGAALMNTHAVDLVLSGHNHDLHIDFDGRTALVESEQDANYVTIVDIDVARTRDEASRSLPWWPDFRVLDTAKIDPDPSMLAKVRDYQAGLAKRFDVEIATIAAPLDSRTGAVRSGECAIGNLIADALRKAATAEIAIVNGGGIRGDKFYPAGTKLSKRDILDELPFGNKTMLTIVPGKAILAALENGFSQVDRLSGRFPQVAGLSIVADPVAAPGARVKTVTVNGEALDLARDYKLATNDFLARGGDGYGMLAGKTHVTADSGTRLVALDVIDYVEAAKIIDAKVEGRIEFR
ncbi:MAG: bifunctional metallophosphatase/5'-nucleotidase [Pseudomonadota bacterium]|nr:bifunctional metallophosphatase/5'-nucleotidase [Pseudomonadota bacterium]